MKGLGRTAQQLTLGFDGGNSSKNNAARLEEARLHYVGALPGRWAPDLLTVPRQAYQRLTLAGTKHLKVYRSDCQLWGKERTLLVMFSPSFYRKQRAAMNRLQAKVKGDCWSWPRPLSAGGSRVREQDIASLRWKRKSSDGRDGIIWESF